MSAGAVLGAVGSVLGAVEGAVNTGLNIWTSLKNEKRQEEQLEYQKEVQGKTWEREDNAVQRRVADLKAAGLSPVLAAGSAAQTSSPIQVTAPQFGEMRSQIDPVGKIQAAQAIMRGQLDIAQTAAQNELIELQKKNTAAQTAKTQIEAELIDNHLLNFQQEFIYPVQAAITKQNTDVMERLYNLDIARKQGVRSDLSGVGENAYVAEQIRKAIEVGKLPGGNDPALHAVIQLLPYLARYIK